MGGPGRTQRGIMTATMMCVLPRVTNALVEHAVLSPQGDGRVWCGAGADESRTRDITATSLTGVHGRGKCSL
ncbi:hypothetical protein FKM82_016867 [Ascaphus truei]